MDFIKKNRKKIVLGTLLSLLCIAGLFASLQKKLMHVQNDLDCTVYPLKLSLRDTLHYKDITGFATTRRWDFGDGNISLSDSGIYKYSKAGYYHLKLLVNNTFSRTIEIEVTDTVVTQKMQDSLVFIDAPDTAMQSENIVFRARTINDARSYSWEFGETHNVDSKEAMAIYAYKTPGVYYVTLLTEINEYPIIHKIRILPSYKNDTTALTPMYDTIDNDFKWRLQQIANGKSFNMHYNYLLTRYLCNNEKAVIKINGDKMNDFNSYCLGLQFEKNIVIQTVKVGLDDQQKCVTKVDVQQGK